MKKDKELETDTKLIKTGDLDKYVEELLAKNKTVVLDCEKLLPHIVSLEIKGSIERQVKKAQGLVEALERGYIPVTGINQWGYTRVDAKYKWAAKQVKEVLFTMPKEIKEVWEKVKEEGFFTSFSVTADRGGDPVLVGNRGKTHYLIGAWLNIAPGLSMGFTVRK